MKTYMVGNAVITELTQKDVAALITEKYGVPAKDIKCGSAVFAFELVNSTTTKEED